jgi:hypothetical protein
MKRGNIAAWLMSLFCLLVSSAMTATAQDEGQERFQRRFPFASGGLLAVENYKGQIQIEGWDQEEVAVDVYKRFDGSTANRSRWLSETRVEIGVEGQRVLIKVEYPRHHHGFSTQTGDHDCDNGQFGGAVELTIRVPRRSHLNLDGYKPEMTITSIQGDIRIESYKAPISIVSTTGAIGIDTYKETIKMRDVDIEGRLDIKIYKGEIDIDTSDIGEGATLDTYRGEVVLRLPESTRMSLKLDGGRRSQFESDFAVTFAGKWDQDKLSGTINGGGPTLRFSSYKGSLALRKKAG